MSAPTIQPPPRRHTLRTVILVGIGVVALVVATSITAFVLNQPRLSAHAIVNENGFELSVTGVVARADAGVAPAGTEVTMEVIDPELPGEFSDFATPEGSGVRIVLGDGLQPNSPIHLEFQLSANSDPGATFVIGENKDAPLGVEVLDALWDADSRTLSVATDHLSWFSPASFAAKSLGERFGDWINQFLGTETSAPECFGETADDGVVTYTIDPVPGEVAWPCLSNTGDGLDLSLQSNSGLVWEVLTYPAGTPRPGGATSLAGIVTLEVAHLLDATLEGDGVVVPRETFTIEYERSGPVQVVELQVAPGLSQIATIMWGLSLLFPHSWLEKAAQAECLIDIVKSSTGGAGSELGRTILSCIGTALSGAVGLVVSLLLSGPALLATQLEGLVREISSTNNVRFEITTSAVDLQVSPLPPGATWLYDLEGSGGTSTSGDPDVASVTIDGSTVVFENASNQWVGCDGTVAEATYPLDGESALSLGIGLQTHTPDGLTAHFRVLADGALLLETTITTGTAHPRTTVDISGASELKVEAWTDDECGGASKGYAALLDAYVY